MSLQGFNETYYLGVKLKSLQSQSSEWVGKSTADLRVALTNAGFTPESHYMTWGYQENLAPNEYFNAAEYSRAKATLLYNEGLLNHTNTYASIDEAEAAFKAAWSGDVYQHYLQYGSAEGINPSNSFDESSYFASKLLLLQADPATQPEWGTKTVADLQAFFKNIGLTALAHYESNGKYEGIVVSDVPAGERVIVGGGMGHLYTLTESVVAGHEAVAGEKVLYWGYNPHDSATTTGAAADGGVPVSELVTFLTTITGLDFKQLGLIDANNGLDPFQNVTSLSLSNPLGSQGYTTSGDNNSSTNTLTISFADGSILNAEAKLGTEYFAFLNNLLFDKNGDSRLHEVAVGGTPATEASLQPIKLTPFINNGGTLEQGYTTAGDDTIVSGRLELLHQAYIDGGAGYNILEIEAKGTYAQPAELLNIQEVHVTDLPNFYTTAAAPADAADHTNDGNIDNTNINSNGFPIPNAPVGQDSWIDLSRATSIEKLVVSDGSNDTVGGGSGNLNIVGVCNAATLRLEGGFNSGSTTIQYGQGQTGTLNVELLVGDVNADINLLQNASVLNIDSQGAGNHLHKFFTGGSVNTLYIKGTGAFGVDEDLGGSLNLLHRGQPILIDASANTGGVDLKLTNTQNVTFKGSSADDTFLVATAPIESANDESVTIIDHAGNNHYNVDTYTANITDADGNSNYEVHAAEANIAAGNGNNDFELSVSALTLEAGDGNNTVIISNSVLSTEATYYSPDVVSNIVVMLGDGKNVIDVAQQQNPYESDVAITVGNGGNDIDVLSSGNVTITTGTGDDVIRASGDKLTIDTGAGNDIITIYGTNNDYVAAPNGSLFNINTGTGSATINLGATQAETNMGDGSIVAHEGSSIIGSNITLFVNTTADLQAATLTGVTKVILDDDNTDYSTSPQANDNNVSGSAMLTLTSDQFKAITDVNPNAFSVDGSLFNTHAFVKIIVTESTSLTELGVDHLAGNVDLFLELNDGVTLTMTAKELHTHVAQNGVTLAHDGNTDDVSGKVVITGGGLNFDPFNTNDKVSSVIDGQTYYGGSLSSDFAVDGSDTGTIAGDTRSEWYNVTVKSLVNGWNRPADAAAEVVLTLDTGALHPVTQAAFTSSLHSNLQIIGDKEINFTGDINLGEGFTVDFSALEASANNLTIAEFQDVKQIRGNAESERVGDATLYVKLDNKDKVDKNPAVGAADEDGDDVPDGLVSSGVSRYIVTDINDTLKDKVVNGQLVDNGGIKETALINLGDRTEDLTVIGLRGNYNAVLKVDHVGTDVDFELQGGTKKSIDGPVGTSNIGELEASYEFLEAQAVVTIDHSVAGDVRAFRAYGITVNNAEAVTINVVGADATIDKIAGNTVDANGAPTDFFKTLTFESAHNVVVGADLPSTVETVDASAVEGTFAATVDAAGDFTFDGAQGGNTLTIVHEFSQDASVDIDGGAGLVNLAIAVGLHVDLSEATLINVSGIVIDGDAFADHTSLTLNFDQLATIGASHITVKDAGDQATLNMVGLDNQLYTASILTTGISRGEVTLLDKGVDGVVTLHTDTDLTGFDSLTVPEGMVLNLSAKQFEQLGNGTITGADDTNFTVNITGLTQADVDNGFDTSNITAATLTITLAETVIFPADDNAVDPAIITDLTGVDTIIVGNGMTLTLPTILDADGKEIVGGTGSTLVFTEAESAVPATTIDASGFNVDTLKFVTSLIGTGVNVDHLFQDLPADVLKVMYNGTGQVVAEDQTFVMEAKTTTMGDIVFNKTANNAEIGNFTLNLDGGTEITGNLVLNTDDENGQIHSHLQKLTINSTGTETNLLTGKAGAFIGGITTQGIDQATTNNLLDVTINAQQTLTIRDGIMFESVVNDNEVAKLTVTDSADVNVGMVDTSDDEVDGLTVVNSGTGTLSLTLDAANLDQETTEPVNNDALSFTGGHIALTIADSVGDDNTVNLSDDVLTGISKITLGNGLATDGLGGDVTLTQAQFEALGAANVLDDGLTATSAALRLVEFGSVKFDATTATNVTVSSITIAAGNVTLNTATNLTGVGEIRVQEGSTLNLTAAQFQQLKGNGTIVGLDTDGDGTVSSFTVNITGLKQADIERAADPAITGDTEGFDLAGITGGTDANAPKVNVTLADSAVTMGNYSSTGELTLPSDLGVADKQIVEFVLANGQTLSFVNSTQADGRAVTGGTNSTLMLKFSGVDATDDDGQIDASGFSVTTLKALATFVGDHNVENLLQNVPSSVTELYYADSLDLGFVSATNRIVVVDTAVSVPGYLMYNDLQPTQEVRSLDLTLSGGSKIDGNVDLSTTLKPNGTTDPVQRYLESVTIHSTGTTTNTITGNLTAEDPDGGLNTTPGDNIENNLLDVTIDATQKLVLGKYDATTGAHTSGGDIIFTSIDDAASALLTIKGSAAVTVHGLDVSDNTSGDIDTPDIHTPDIHTLTIDNQGTGQFTVTGGTAAIEGSIETLLLKGTGTGAMAFGTNAVNGVVDAKGLSSGTLSSIDASGLTGALNLGVIDNVDSEAFTFTAGSGVTKLTLTNDVLDALGKTALWKFDFTKAAADSEFHLNDATLNAFGNSADLLDTTTSNELNITLGNNTTLYIDADTDFTQLDSLFITPGKTIVLAKGVDLMMTAAQASGLKIIAAADVITDVPQVHLTNLGTAAYDLSGIAATVAGEASLATDDVTLASLTNLGDFTVQLLARSTSDATLAGQTVRFATVAQAYNAITVVFPDNTHDTDTGLLAPGVQGDNDNLMDQLGDTGNSSTNVVWLFDKLDKAPDGKSLPVDTSKYDAELGRLIYSSALVNSYTGKVEDMFTTLPSTILRVDLASVSDAIFWENSIPVDRTMEFSNFTTASNLTYSDLGSTAPVEHLRSLDLVLGGQVTVGNILIDDIAQPSGYNPEIGDQFKTLRVDSHLALTGNNILASKKYVNNNNGGTETGESTLPQNINTVGNIGVGSNYKLDLLEVNLNTYGKSVYGNSSAGDGATLSVGTITFGTAKANSPATLRVDGANNVTIASVDVTDLPDPQITELTVDLSDMAADTDGNAFSGTLTLPGGASPAFKMGSKAETLTFKNGDKAFGTITLGNANNAGVAGNELSVIDASLFDGTLNLGTIAQIDSSDDLNENGIVNGTYDGVSEAAFRFTTGYGVTTATLGTANSLTPALIAGSHWLIDYTNAAATSTLTITSAVTFNAGGLLAINLDESKLVISGAVNLSVLGTGLNISGGSINVTTGNALTLTAAQANNLTIDGAGTINIVGQYTGGQSFDNIDVAVINLADITGLASGTSSLVLDLTGESGQNHTITGSNFADNIVGDKGADSITGGLGNDSIMGGAGANTIDGGAGDDTLVFASAAELNGNATVIGGANVDTIRVDGADLTLIDTNFAKVKEVESLMLNGSVAQKVTLGVTTNAVFANGITITASNAATLHVDGALSTVAIAATGTDKNDTLIGGSAADSLTGGAGVDSIFAGAGNDTLVGAQDDALLDGGAGADVLYVVADFNDVSDGQINAVETVTLRATGLTVSLDAQSEGLTINGFATGASIITAGSGADTITGGNGNDMLTGGAGVDSIVASDGNDTLVGAQDDALLDGGAGADVLHVGANFNDVSDAQIDNIETVALTKGGLTVSLDAQSKALAINSYVYAPLTGVATQGTPITAEATTFTVTQVMNAGDSLTINGVTVTATDDGNTAAEVASMFLAGATVAGLTHTGSFGIPAGWAGAAVGVTGAAVTFTNTANGDVTDFIASIGGQRASFITGGSGADTITGSNGNDILTGGAGVDSILAGAGDDTLVGAEDDALLDGGAGADVLHVGANFNDVSNAQIDNIETVLLTKSALTVSLDAQREALTINGYVGYAPLTGVATQGTDTTAETTTFTVTQVMNAGDSLTINGVTVTATDDGNIAADVASVFRGDTVAGLTLTGASGTPAGWAGAAVGGTGATVTFTNTANGDVTDFTGSIGGLGSSVITGGSGADTITGGSGNDSLTGGAGADSILAAGGDDTIVGAQGDTLLDGGAGADVLHVGANFNDVSDVQINAIETVTLTATGLTVSMDAQNRNEGLTINGFATGASTITGGLGNDTIISGSGNDSLTGAAGADSIFAGGGDDTIVGAQDDALLDGGTGNNVLQIGANFNDINDTQIANILTVALKSAGLAVSLDAQSENLAINAFANYAPLNGVKTEGTADTPESTTFTLANVMNTGESLNINGLIVTATDDGNTAAEVASVFRGSTVAGLTLTDAFVTPAGWTGAALGGAGATVTFTNMANGNVADFTTSVSGLGATITGGSGDDTITGSNGNDSLVGGAGVDSILAGAGNDTLVGAQDDALLDGGAGADVLHIGANFNDVSDAQINAVETVTLRVTGLTVSMDAQSEVLTINGFATGASTITGGLGNDTIFGGSGNDSLTGGAGSDTFHVDAGSDTISDLATGDILLVTAGATATANNVAAFVATAATSNAGIATVNAVAAGGNISVALATGANGFALNGGASANTLLGSANADIITGGAGADIITGGGGVDSLIGGLGADVFVLAAVADFVGGETINGTSEQGTDDTIRIDASGAYNFTGFANISNIDVLSVNADTAATTITLVDGVVGTADANNDGIGGDIEIIDHTPGTANTNAVNINASTLTGTNAINVSATTFNGNDNLTGGTGADMIHGGGGADVITGGAGVDTLFGDAGTDLFIIASATDGGVGETYDGGADSDTLRVTGTAALDLSDDHLTSIEILDLTTDNASQNVTLTAAQRSLITTINAQATDSIMIDELSGVVNGTVAIDKFVFTNNEVNVTINNFVHGSDIIQLGGTNGVSAVVVAALGGDVAHRVVFDTAANLGGFASLIGDHSANVNDIHWAVTSDTGVIYYDADGNWTSDVHVVGVVAGLAIGDILVA